jgi:hypothetical protein
LPDAKHVFASVTLPEAVVPVVEQRVVDGPVRAMTGAPLVLPDTKTLFVASLPPPVLSLPVQAAQVVASAEPTASAATMMAALSPAKPAAAISPAPAALRVSVLEQKMVAESAPSHAMASPKPVITPVSVSPALSQAEARTLVASIPAVPAVAVPAKPVVVASAMPQKKIAVSHMPAVAAAPPQPATPVQAARRVAEKPVTVAPVRQVAGVTAAKNAPVRGKVLTIGQPIKLLNASGKPDGARTVLRRLTSLGWTMRPADSRGQPATMLFYPAQNIAAAKAMQRTLPFPVRLVAESSKTSGMRLVIGRDYLSWKPKNSRIATLWQKRTIIASSQKLSLRGDR